MECQSVPSAFSCRYIINAISEKKTAIKQLNNDTVDISAAIFMLNVMQVSRYRDSDIYSNVPKMKNHEIPMIIKNLRLVSAYNDAILTIT